MNRSIVEIKSGGANRSWTYELLKLNDLEYLFKLIFLKQKNVIEFHKKFHIDELLCKKVNNHLLQVFHGNNISSCMYFNKNYLLTGSEDTQIIVSKIEANNRLTHCHHLQGHDSVVKCMSVVSLSENMFLLVTAGGKANMKLWKIVVDGEIIKQIILVCEFKRFNKDKKINIVGLESDPDIRFMHSDIYSEDNLVFYLYFACSDGFIRYL